ncbi:hypothetical protein JNM05_16550 [bacterium]|nr:hypothetical protein [bacterium]
MKTSNTTNAGRLGSALKYVLFVLLILFAADSTQAQARKKRTPAQSSDSKMQHFIGPIAQFNNISGIEWEMSMKNKTGSSSRSTFSLIGGFASRYSKIEIDEITARTETRWINGVGGAVVLNNYINSYKEGPYWAVGASGNYYFKKGIASSIEEVTPDSAIIVNDKSGNLKTFSVFLIAGYKFRLSDKYAIKPQIGAGIMGSPFRSSSSSEINGLFVNLGCSIIFKWK